LDKHKIESLISLVDDQDEAVFELVQKQLFELGSDVIPMLYEAYENNDSGLMGERLKSIIDQLNLSKAQTDLRDWKENNSRNLYEGLSIIARYQYPKLDIEKITRTINKIRQELWLEINDNMTALEKVRILNHLFFNVHMFRGDTKDFFAPENSFLNDVIIRKKGNPISISAIYSIVAQSVNIPIYGVNMPNHFIVAFADRLYSQPLSDIKINNILFYINPFNGGEIYSLKEMRHFLTSMKIVPRDRFLLPCSNITIIRRNLTNLVTIYTNMEDKEKADRFKTLQEIVS